jgi:hypothetical protein
MAEPEHQTPPSSDEILEEGQPPAGLGRHIHATEAVGTNPDNPAHTPFVDNSNSTFGYNTSSVYNQPSSAYSTHYNVQPNDSYFTYAPAPGYNSVIYWNQVPFQYNNPHDNIFRTPYPYQPSSTYSIPRGDRGRLAGHGRLPGRGRPDRSRGGQNYASQRPQYVTGPFRADHHHHPPFVNQRAQNNMDSSQHMNVIGSSQEPSTPPIPWGQAPRGIDSNPSVPQTLTVTDYYLYKRKNFWVPGRVIHLSSYLLYNIDANLR